jgi:enoyl-CoA hydratase/carnithine racemase
MDATLVNQTVSGDVLTVSLARSEALNALTYEMRAALASFFDRAGRDDEIGGVLISGGGARLFSSGGDTSEVRNLVPGCITAWVDSWMQLYRSLASLPKPCVVDLGGGALGGGLQLAALADWRIAAPDGVLGQPEVAVGIEPVVGPWLFGYLHSPSIARRLTLTSQPLSGMEAYRVGIIDSLAEHDELPQVSHDALNRLIRLDPASFCRAKSRLMEPIVERLPEIADRWRQVMTEFVESGRNLRIAHR